MQVVPILPKQRKFRGQVYNDALIVGEADAHAHIERNQSIRMVGRYNNRDFDITFKMGDTVEYDSYNLSYHGEIVGITDKGVTIRPQYYTTTKRLGLHTFMWRNYDFDLERSNAQNLETSYSI